MYLGIILFDLTKVVFSPLPFYVCGYNFSKFKSAPDFMKELELFHFDEKSFHINDSQGKVAAHRALLKVNFEYIDHVDNDEELYRKDCNMTALNKQLRRKITVSGGKGSSSSNPK